MRLIVIVVDVVVVVVLVTLQWLVLITHLILV